jgi:hypothetical protein
VDAVQGGILMTGRPKIFEEQDESLYGRGPSTGGPADEARLGGGGCRERTLGGCGTPHSTQGKVHDGTGCAAQLGDRKPRKPSAAIREHGACPAPECCGALDGSGPS